MLPQCLPFRRVEICSKVRNWMASALRHFLPQLSKFWGPRNCLVRLTIVKITTSFVRLSHHLPIHGRKFLGVTIEFSSCLKNPWSTSASGHSSFCFSSVRKFGKYKKIGPQGFLPYDTLPPETQGQTSLLALRLVFLVCTTFFHVASRSLRYWTFLLLTLSCLFVLLLL